MRGEVGTPDCENLGALVDALEAVFGFGDGFDGSDPELFGKGRMQADADALPSVFHFEHGTGQDSAEAQVLRAGGRLEEAIRLGRREEIDDGFDADGQRLSSRLGEAQAEFAADFDAARSGAK